MFEDDDEDNSYAKEISTIETFNQFEEKSQTLVFEKYVDGFDSNGFANDIMAPLKESIPVTPPGKPDSQTEYNDAYLEAEFKKMTEEFSDLNNLFDYEYGQPVDNSSLVGEESGGGVVGSSVPSVSADDMEIDASYFKENLLTAAKTAEKNKNINKTLNSKANNSPNTESGGVPKTSPSEKIDCIVESCTILKRMNALNDDNSSKGEEELVEIAAIIPTNSSCNQLLVKLLKTKVIATNRVIMANVAVTDSDNDGDDYENNYESNINNDLQTCQARSMLKKSVGGQLLLFDCIDGSIPNEHKKAITFSRAKCPKDICILPNFQYLSDGRDKSSAVAENYNHDNIGAFSVVCTDGSIELFTLNNFQRISSIKEEQHFFISVTYCRSLERLCCCTKEGVLIFYSLNDTDESGDEMIDMEEESCTAVTLNDSNNELSVTDGANVNQDQREKENISACVLNDNLKQLNPEKLPYSTNIKIDCGSNQSCFSVPGFPASPSPSSMTANATTSNLLANRNGDLTLNDLRSLYALTLFDDKSIPYTAEVPSCWNNLVQAQKQRKQSQHTWRLHNDA